jgi:photosystem II stability/assembly factor-like uncharacterized protein
MIRRVLNVEQEFDPDQSYTVNGSFVQGKRATLTVSDDGRYMWTPCVSSTGNYHIFEAVDVTQYKNKFTFKNDPG